MGVNVKGVFFCSQAAARLMIPRRHGKIVKLRIQTSAFVASSHPEIAYDTSKGAVRQMTIAMAAELAPHGINVNAVAPGNHQDRDDQGFARHGGGPRLAGWRASRWGRVGQPDDIAAGGAVPVLGRRELHHRAHARRRTVAGSFSEPAKLG